MRSVASMSDYMEDAVLAIYVVVVDEVVTTLVTCTEFDEVLTTKRADPLRLVDWVPSKWVVATGSRLGHCHISPLGRQTGVVSRGVLRRNGIVVLSDCSVWAGTCGYHSARERDARCECDHNRL